MDFPRDAAALAACRGSGGRRVGPFLAGGKLAKLDLTGRWGPSIILVPGWMRLAIGDCRLKIED